MLKPKQKSWAIVTGAANNIALSQTPSGAGALTLAGALASGGVIPEQDLGYVILFTTVLDESAKTATITGFDADLKAVTEVVTLPNASTAASTGYFRKITSIAVSGALAGAITVGTRNATDCAVTPTFPLDGYQANTSIAVNISGTINYDLEKCFERPTAGQTPNWVSGGLTGKTADDNTAYTAPTGAVRINVNSYTNGATLSAGIAQSRSH